MSERSSEEDRLVRLARREDSDDDAWVRDHMRESLFGIATPARRMGRYGVERRLGQGGMGEVFVGHDSGLDRRVALKLIKGVAGERRRARFLREGRALARLSHPNIVQVHEVGEHENGLFIAMEWVRGQTLAAWVRDEERSVDAIVGAYVEAGRGLAAAHAMGIVHRDFKPDNAMMGEDGRVRVLDFGLARRLGDDDVGSASGTPDPTDGVDTLTTAGSVLGTPAYMAPEQHLGRDATAASDQFSLCVSLFEALHGVRPFAGADRQAVLAAIDRGAIEPGRRRVPRRVRRAMQRALAADPAHRFPTMDALLDMLQTRVRPLRIAGAALVLGIAGGLGLSYGDAPLPCEGFEREAEGRVPGLWDGPSREQLSVSLLATDEPHVESAWTIAQHRLDAWAAELGGARLEACRAHRVREEESAVLYDLRMACLQGHEDRLRALLGELGRERAPTWQRLEQIGESLPTSDECDDARSLHRRAVVRPSGPEVDEIDALLARAHAQLSLGHVSDALDTAQRAGASAQRHGARSVRSDVDALRGHLRIVAGEYPSGIEALTSAAHDAQRDARDRVAGDRWWRLANLASVSMADAVRGRRWLEDAAVSYERAGVLERPRISDRLDQAGALLDRQEGHWERAEATSRRRLARWRRAVAAEEPGAELELERVLVDLGSVLLDRDQTPEASALFEEALALDLALRGALHPRTALVRYDLGLAALERGDVTPAQEHLEQALAIWSVSPEDTPAKAARAHRALAAIAFGAHELDRASEHARSARRLLERSLPADHLDVAEAYNLEGVVRFGLGDLEGSVTAYRSALSIYERAHGPEHIEVAMPASNLGESLVGLGRFAEARPLFDRALVLLRAQLGDDAADLAYPLKGRGLAWLGLGDAPRARTDLLRAWAVTDGFDGHERAEIALGLSMALRADEPERARAFGERARALASDASGRARLARLENILTPDE